jgi:NADPH:quinone reductase-like Zn-dependent oxidoreductase
MRVIEVGEFGGPQFLRLAERPMPELGPYDVLVRMQAVSLNFRDYAMLHGRSASRGKIPYVPVSDGCGVVEAVGSAVTRFAKGDRAVPTFFQSWLSGPPTVARLSTTLGAVLDGVAGEYRALHEDGLIKPPSYLTAAEAATLPCAGLTAWRALTGAGALWPGDTVLLQGTGGVSIFALQFAVAMGLDIIITSSSDEKLERARAMGAGRTINYRTTPNWAEAARAMTGGRGVDLVVEVGGAGTFQQSLQAVRVDGRIAVVGMLSGMEQTLSVAAIYAANVNLTGITVGSREMFERMSEGLEKTRIRPVIGRTFDWTDARAAFEALGQGDLFGKIVLSFGPEVTAPTT